MTASNREALRRIDAAFRRGIRPDPLPVPPGWLTPEQRSAWLLGAREGIAQGRRLAAAEAADGLPVLPPPEPLEGGGDGC